MGEIVDLAFAIEGGTVSEEHADALHDTLCDALPWFAAATDVAVHPLRGLSPGQGERYLSRHARLVLRLPASRIAAARALCGREIDLGGAVRIGAATARELSLAPVLYSRFVWLGEVEETAFIAACRAAMAALAVTATPLAGKARRQQVDGAARVGYSLMLHGLSAEDSLRVQCAGLGSETKRGCGVFVPHKSVVAVGA